MIFYGATQSDCARRAEVKRMRAAIFFKKYQDFFEL
jgi:hypothetical protein